MRLLQVIIALAIVTVAREELVHLRLVYDIELHLDLFQLFLLARLAPKLTTADRFQLFYIDLYRPRGGYRVLLISG